MSIGIALIIVLILSFPPREKAYACTCEPEDGNTKQYIETSYKASDVVFSGRVVKLVEIGYSDIREQPLVSATIEVYEVWKGSLYRHFIVKTDICDFPLHYGEEYLIFAYENGGDLYADTFCNPTTELINADKYIGLLGVGSHPNSENPNITQEDLVQIPINENIDEIIIIIGICITLMMLGFILRQWIMKTNQERK